MKKGITLIEIMVTMVISSIVILAAYSFFNASIRSWDFSSARMDAAQSSVYVIETVERLLKEKTLNVSEWFFPSSVSAEISVVNSALSSKIRTGIPFKDGVFLSFAGEDEIDDHAHYCGIYLDRTSSEVLLWESRFSGAARVVTLSEIARNVSEMSVRYYNNDLDTLELWAGGTWHQSREIMWIGVMVKSEVGTEVSSGSRMICLWR